MAMQYQKRMAREAQAQARHRVDLRSGRRSQMGCEQINIQTTGRGGVMVASLVDSLVVMDEVYKEFLRQEYGFDKHDLLDVVWATRMGFGIISGAELVNKRKLKRQTKGVE
jgi:hypothetical protein